MLMKGTNCWLNDWFVVGVFSKNYLPIWHLAVWVTSQYFDVTYDPFGPRVMVLKYFANEKGEIYRYTDVMIIKTST